MPHYDIHKFPVSRWVHCVERIGDAFRVSRAYVKESPRLATIVSISEVSHVKSTTMGSVQVDGSDKTNDVWQSRLQVATVIFGKTGSASIQKLASIQLYCNNVWQIYSPLSYGEIWYVGNDGMTIEIFWIVSMKILALLQRSVISVKAKMDTMLCQIGKP